MHVDFLWRTVVHFSHRKIFVQFCDSGSFHGLPITLYVIIITCTMCSDSRKQHNYRMWTPSDLERRHTDRTPVHTERKTRAETSFFWSLVSSGYCSWRVPVCQWQLASWTPAEKCQDRSTAEPLKGQEGFNLHKNIFFQKCITWRGRSPRNMGNSTNQAIERWLSRW